MSPSGINEGNLLSLYQFSTDRGTSFRVVVQQFIKLIPIRELQPFPDITKVVYLMLMNPVTICTTLYLSAFVDKRFFYLQIPIS